MFSEKESDEVFDIFNGEILNNVACIYGLHNNEFEN